MSIIKECIKQALNEFYYYDTITTNNKILIMIYKKDRILYTPHVHVTDYSKNNEIEVSLLDFNIVNVKKKNNNSKINEIYKNFLKYIEDDNCLRHIIEIWINGNKENKHINELIERYRNLLNIS